MDPTNKALPPQKQPHLTFPTQVELEDFNDQQMDELRILVENLWLKTEAGAGINALVQVQNKQLQQVSTENSDASTHYIGELQGNIAQLNQEKMTLQAEIEALRVQLAIQNRQFAETNRAAEQTIEQQGTIIQSLTNNNLRLTHNEFLYEKELTRQDLRYKDEYERCSRDRSPYTQRAVYTRTIEQCNKIAETRNQLQK